MQIKLLKIVLFLVFLSFVSNVQAQSAEDQSNTSQQTTTQGSDDIVEVGEAVIKVEVEKPQVQLFSQRIKPEFDDVNLEKSFIKEILDEGQKLQINNKSSDEPGRIDIQTIINRKR